MFPIPHGDAGGDQRGGSGNSGPQLAAAFNGAPKGNGRGPPNLPGSGLFGYLSFPRKYTGGGGGGADLNAGSLLCVCIVSPEKTGWLGAKLDGRRGLQ